MNIKKINKKIFLKIILFAFVIVAISFHSKASAVYIYSKSTNETNMGDTIVINVLLNTEGKQINSIDGDISFSYQETGDFSIEDINLASSSFTVWLKKPVLDGKGSIHFVGGVPGGVIGENLLIFKVAVKFSSPGSFIIFPNGMNAYLNDGLGTAIKITGSSSIVNISNKKNFTRNELKDIVSSDQIPPESFIIDLRQDRNAFDGKKFISFQTTDNESGVDHYEVREGSNPIVISDNYYILKDQRGMMKITVFAYDKAGNITSSVYNPAFRALSYYYLSIVVALVLIILIIFYKIKKSKNEKK